MAGLKKTPAKTVQSQVTKTVSSGKYIYSIPTDVQNFSPRRGAKSAQTDGTVDEIMRYPHQLVQHQGEVCVSVNPLLL